jgi:hypothetical protein
LCSEVPAPVDWSKIFSGAGLATAGTIAMTTAVAVAVFEPLAVELYLPLGSGGVYLAYQGGNQLKEGNIAGVPSKIVPLVVPLIGDMLYPSKAY